MAEKKHRPRPNRSLMVSPDYDKELSGQEETGLKFPVVRLPGKTHLSKILLFNNPWEARNLSRKLERIDKEKTQKKHIYEWNQRQFFISQMFDSKRNLRFRMTNRDDTNISSHRQSETDTNFYADIPIKYDNQDTYFEQTNENISMINPDIDGTTKKISRGTASKRLPSIVVKNSQQIIQFLPSDDELSNEKLLNSASSKTSESPLAHGSLELNDSSKIDDPLTYSTDQILFKNECMKEYLDHENSDVSSVQSNSSNKQKSFNDDNSYSNISIDRRSFPGKLEQTTHNSTLMHHIAMTLPSDLMKAANQEINDQIARKHKCILEETKTILKKEQLADSRWIGLASVLQAL